MDKDKRKSTSENHSVYNNKLPNRGKVRVLLCDTNAQSCQEVYMLLCECSYQVTQANSAAGFYDALKSERPRPDIILAEGNLLLTNGAKMLKSIIQNKELQHIPVIMMLGEHEVSLTFKGLGLGAADYLMKPLCTNELQNLWTHTRRHGFGFV